MSIKGFISHRGIRYIDGCDITNNKPNAEATEVVILKKDEDLLLRKKIRELSDACWIHDLDSIDTIGKEIAVILNPE